MRGHGHKRVLEHFRNGSLASRPRAGGPHSPGHPSALRLSGFSFLDLSCRWSPAACGPVSPHSALQVHAPCGVWCSCFVSRGGAPCFVRRGPVDAPCCGAVVDSAPQPAARANAGLFYGRCSGGCAAVSHSGFNLHFPNDREVGLFFSMGSSGIHISALIKCLFKSFACFNGFICLIEFHSKLS